jgi:hypothetical protein
MKLFSKRTALLVATAFFVALSNGSALACAACYNPAGSDKMNHAAAVGIFAMVIIMFAMLGAVAAFGRHLAYRAKHPLPDYQELLNPDENSDENKDENQPKP